MTESNPQRLLARLNVGFRTDSTRLMALEQHLNLTLRTARSLGLQPGVTPDWTSDWNRHWDRIETALGCLRTRLETLSQFVGSSATGTLDDALMSWDALQSGGNELTASLDAIRIAAHSLDEPFQAQWRDLSSNLETHLETLNAFSESMRVRLHLLQHHPRSAVDAMVDAVVSTLPPLSDPDPVVTERGYQKAVLELEREQHRFLNFFDTLKALSMWIETPEERVEAKRVAQPATTLV